MQTSPLIISIDGNVFTGKSTLIRNLGLPSIEEHSHHTTYAAGRDPWREHKKYLLVEESRIRRQLDAITVLDRSIFSLAAHAYALWAISTIDFRARFINHISQPDHIILWPEVSIVLVEEYDICVKRYRADKRLHTQKSTADIFINRRYFDAINKFYETLSQQIQIMIIKGGSIEKRKNTVLGIIGSSTRNKRETVRNGLRWVLHE